MGAALALEDDVISPSDLDGVTDLLEYLKSRTVSASTICLWNSAA